MVWTNNSNIWSYTVLTSPNLTIFRAAQPALKMYSTKMSQLLTRNTLQIMKQPGFADQALQFKEIIKIFNFPNIIAWWDPWIFNIDSAYKILYLWKHKVIFISFYKCSKLQFSAIAMLSLVRFYSLNLVIGVLRDQNAQISQRWEQMLRIRYKLIFEKSQTI